MELAWRVSGDAACTLWPGAGTDLSRDCKLLATASADGGARVWRVPDGACTAVLHAGAKAGQLNRVRFGSVRTSSMVVVATASGEALAFQLPSGSGAPAELRPALSFKGHTGPCHDLAIGENGEVLATASQDRAIRLWKLRSGEHARALPGGGEVVALAFSSRGAANLATATAKGTVKVFGIVPRGGDAGMFQSSPEDAETRAMVHEALGHPGVVVGLKLSLFGGRAAKLRLSVYPRTEGPLKSATGGRPARGRPAAPPQQKVLVPQAGQSR